MAQLRVALVLLLLFTAGEVRADVEPIRIEYRADPGCPSEAEFRRQVFSRTGSARLAQASEPARVFAIELRRRPRGATGSLVIREQDGATVARRVNGKNCKDIAMVLALASALAIDPRAELAPADELDTEGGQEVEPEEDASFGSGTSSTTTELTPSPDSDRGDRTRTVSIYEVPGSDTPREWRHRLAIGPRAALAFSPEPAIGVTLAYAWATSESRTSAWLGLGVAWLEALPTRVSGATADFRFLTLRPTVCLMSLPLSYSVATSPCVATELGIVTGAGSELAVEETKNRFWANAELSLRLDATIDGPWFGGVEIGVAFPLSRYRFVFADPEQSVYPVPAVAGTGGLNLGLRF